MNFVSRIEENNVALEAYQLLVQEWGIDINGFDQRGCNVICCIFQDKRVHDLQFSLKTVLQLGADAGHRNNVGLPALHCAVFCGRFTDLVVKNRVVGLLSQNGQLRINQKTLHGETILHLFVWRLIEISNAKWKSSVAVEAISFSSHGPAALKVLIDFGADRSIKCMDGKTALERLREDLDNATLGEWERAGYRKFVAVPQKLISILESHVPATQEAVAPTGVRLEIVGSLGVNNRCSLNAASTIVWMRRTNLS